MGVRTTTPEMTPSIVQPSESPTITTTVRRSDVEVVGSGVARGRSFVSWPSRRCRPPGASRRPAGSVQDIARHAAPDRTAFPQVSMPFGSFVVRDYLD